MQAVADCGFAVSPYPITLSLEMHCSIEQQVVLVKILKTVRQRSIWHLISHTARRVARFFTVNLTVCECRSSLIHGRPTLLVAGARLKAEAARPQSRRPAVTGAAHGQGSCESEEA